MNLLTVNMTALLADAPELPPQLLEVLALVFGTMGGTSLLKKVATILDTKLGGYGAVAVSAVVAVGLTGLSVAMGWSGVTIPACSLTAPGECALSFLGLAGLVTALANALYMYVYERVATPAPTPVSDSTDGGRFR